MEIEYCPTESMVGDLLTKPLQGSKFIEFRNIILGEKWKTTIVVSSNYENQVTGHQRSVLEKHTVKEYYVEHQ